MAQFTRSRDQCLVCKKVRPAASQNVQHLPWRSPGDRPQATGASFFRALERELSVLPPRLAPVYHRTMTPEASEKETTDADEAYAWFPELQPTQYCDDWLQESP